MIAYDKWIHLKTMRDKKIDTPTKRQIDGKTKQ